MLDKNEMLQVESDENVWELKLENAYLWDYVRSRLTDQYLPYVSKNFSIRILDFIGLFQFIFLSIKKRDCIFIVGRVDMLEYVEQLKNEFKIKNYLLFIREETPEIKGNAKIIEFIRLCFRRLSFIFAFYKFREIKKKLLNIKYIRENLSFKEVNSIVSNFLGDIYFNKAIKRILKGRVFYTNCIIPKVERSMQLMNSYEIQHGVIHDNHPDYYNVPMNYRIIAINKITEDVLRRVGFQGEIINVDIKYKMDEKKNKYDMIIFTTVSEAFSRDVESFLSKSNLENIRIQPHPKDKYSYSNKKIIEKRLRPTDGDLIVMGDSTLIFQCVEFNKHFYLLDPLSFPGKEDEIRAKYGKDVNFTLIKSLNELSFH